MGAERETQVRDVQPWAPILFEKYSEDLSRAAWYLDASEARRETMAPWWHCLEHDALKDAARGLINSETVALDLAVTSGRSADFLLEQGAGEVWSIDTDSDLVDLLASKLPQANFMHGDVLKLDDALEMSGAPKTYDLVLAHMLTYLLPNDDYLKLIQNASRALSVGGTFIYTTLNPEAKAEEHDNWFRKHDDYDEDYHNNWKLQVDDTRWADESYYYRRSVIHEENAMRSAGFNTRSSLVGYKSGENTHWVAVMNRKHPNLNFTVEAKRFVMVGTKM